MPYKCDVIGSNIIRFENPEKNKFFIVPKIIGGRYEVNNILSDTSGFGLILKAKDKFLNNKNVLIKMNNYKGKIQKKNLDSSKIIAERRKDLTWEKNILITLKELGIQNIPFINNYIEGYSPMIHWPDGAISGSPFLDDYAYNEPYIILQFIDGYTLSDFIEKQCSFNPKILSTAKWQLNSLKIVHMLLKILIPMHNANYNKIMNMIYQDLKPDNILISPNGNITLIDFGGTALIMKDGTQCKRGISTNGYMAPEVKDRSMNFSPRTDIYSLGILLWELSTGKNPLHNCSDDGIFNNPGCTEFTIHETIQEIIKKAIEKNPDDRYQTAEEMLKDVDSAINEFYKIIPEQALFSLIQKVLIH